VAKTSEVKKKGTRSETQRQKYAIPAQSTQIIGGEKSLLYLQGKGGMGRERAAERCRRGKKQNKRSLPAKSSFRESRGEVQDWTRDEKLRRTGQHEGEKGGRTSGE